jgi:hypothetical protein
VPVAARDARIREVLLAYCRDELAPLLHLVQDTVANRDLPELAMGFARIYRADMFGSAGRDLTLARLRQDLSVAREAVLEGE